MSHQSDQEQALWDQEQLILAKIKQENPQSLQCAPYTNAQILPEIGILAHENGLPSGFIKYRPTDFIVEEIQKNGDVTETNTPLQNAIPKTDSPIWQVDMVKTVLSTMDAADRIAEALSIPVENISWAGVKDDFAMTSQQVTIEGVSAEQILNLDLPGIILHNIQPAQEAIQIGALTGNRFFLNIRTDKEVTQDWLDSQVAKISGNGVFNYYGIQRFLEPRIIAHEIGKYIMQGDAKSAVRHHMLHVTPYEPEYTANVRREAAAYWGNWKQMKQVFSQLPYWMRYEIRMLDVLMSSVASDPYKEALEATGQQAHYWCIAYGSKLTNEKLSEYALSGNTPPKKLRLLMSEEKASYDTYASMLKTDGTHKYLDTVRQYKNVRISRAPWIKPVIHPVFHAYTATNNGVVLSFDLGKGAYATTVLLHFFDLYQSPPTPNWFSTNFVDPKATCNEPPIEPNWNKLAEGYDESALVNNMITVKDTNPMNELNIPKEYANLTLQELADKAVQENNTSLASYVQHLLNTIDSAGSDNPATESENTAAEKTTKENTESAAETTKPATEEPQQQTAAEQPQPATTSGESKWNKLVEQHGAQVFELPHYDNPALRYAFVNASEPSSDNSSETAVAVLADAEAQIGALLFSGNGSHALYGDNTEEDKVELRDVVRVIRMEEARKRGIDLDGESGRALSKPGELDEMPGWNFDHQANTLVWEGPDDSQISSEEMKQAVYAGLYNELLEANCPPVGCKGPECYFFMYQLPRCKQRKRESNWKANGTIREEENS